MGKDRPLALDQILTVDIGNTTITLGLFSGEDLSLKGAIPTRPGHVTAPVWALDDLRGEISAFFEKANLPPSSVTGAILSSVVPALDPVLMGAVRDLTGRKVMKVSKGMETGIGLGRYDLSLLGMDRIVDLTGALRLYSAPLAVWDLGTATTLSVLDGEGTFIGGMISPGVGLSLRALSEHTAQLPLLQPEETDSLLGLDTRSNMEAGTGAATGVLIEGMIGRLQREVGPDLTPVLTGGLSHLVLPWIREEVTFDPDLTLKGLRVLSLLNRNKYQTT